MCCSWHRKGLPFHRRNEFKRWPNEMGWSKSSQIFGLGLGPGKHGNMGTENNKEWTSQRGESRVEKQQLHCVNCEQKHCQAKHTLQESVEHHVDRLTHTSVMCRTGPGDQQLWPASDWLDNSEHTQHPQRFNNRKSKCHQSNANCTTVNNNEQQTRNDEMEHTHGNDNNNQSTAGGGGGMIRRWHLTNNKSSKLAQHRVICHHACQWRPNTSARRACNVCFDPWRTWECSGTHGCFLVCSSTCSWHTAFCC